MKNHLHRLFGVNLITLLGLIVAWGDSQAQEASVAGIYSLIEVDGEKLPAFSWTEKANGERCKQEILEGALLLDSEGRLAALVTERDFCAHEDGSEAAGKEASTIFPGSYKISGSQIILQFEIGPNPDHGVLTGDLLVVTEGGGADDRDGRTTEYVFRRN